VLRFVRVDRLEKRSVERLQFALTLLAPDPSLLQTSHPG
jgi:hypothetical protein